MGTFDGLQIGTSGLFAARKGVDIAGQNIANINTPGYSRQRVDLKADGGPITPAIHSRWDGDGLGVARADVIRMRDQFLDRRAREEGAFAGKLDENARAYSSIERAIGEPSDTGVSAVLNDFFASWHDVANRPNDQAARAQLALRGSTVASDINQLKDDIRSIGSIASTRLDSIVSEVNAAAAQVAELQKTLLASKGSGLTPHELEDERDVLLQQLAEWTGGTVRFDDDGMATMFVGSTALVRGNRSEPIEVETTGGTFDVTWSVDGRSTEIGGRLGGLLETVNDIVPGKLAELAGVETALATEVNALHTAAYDRNGTLGQDFFTIGANGIEMNQSIVDDPSLIAVSAVAGSLDGSVATQIAGLGGAKDAYREVVVRLGVDGLSANRRLDMQNTVVTRVGAEQESVNGVNMDEELTNLVKFQRAYEANARFIQTVDSLLDVIVNQIGR